MLKVLVLEDQAAVRGVIAEVIEELEVPVEIGLAGSLHEARQRLSEEKWDGLVTDLSLGDGHSLELISELRKQNNALPIILVSGFLTAQRMEEARRLGVTHILAKPFDPAALLDSLRETFVPDSEGEDLSLRRGDTHKSKRLLPEIFEMDRHLGLLYRMFDEMPRHENLAALCEGALSLAMETIHAKRGYLALFHPNSGKLMMMARQGVDMGPVAISVPLEDTPFDALVRKGEEIVEALPGDVVADCWPGVAASHYIAVPVEQQKARIGILCLMEWEDGRPLKGEDRHMLGLLVKKLDTLLDNRATHAALATNMHDTLIALARSLEARDPYTQDHSFRVSALAVSIAREMGMDEETVEVIRIGGLLHDIGKVGIPDAVLLKPGRYTDDEYEVMKGHPSIGDAILENMETLAQERLIVRHHHERWDGRGYPDGLQGEEIPLIARVACVADSIDAMVTHRIYRLARTLEYCVNQLKKGAGSQFDSQVVEAALVVIGQGAVQVQAATDFVGETEMMPPKGADVI